MVTVHFRVSLVSDLLVHSRPTQPSSIESPLPSATVPLSVVWQHVFPLFAWHLFSSICPLPLRLNELPLLSRRSALRSKQTSGDPHVIAVVVTVPVALK